MNSEIMAVDDEEIQELEEQKLAKWEEYDENGELSNIAVRAVEILLRKQDRESVESRLLKDVYDWRRCF